MVNRHGLTSLLFSFIILSFHSSATSEAKSLFQLERGRSLSVEDADSSFLTSPDNTFTCGFYGLGSNAYWFAIWFTNSRDKTVVWVANRARPVNSQGSKVKLEKNGALTLTDVDGAIVWESNTTSTKVNMAELLDTGNLVLKNPQGDVLWQSFGFPTDTLLPSQAFTKSNRLISVLREGGFEPGYFSLYFDGDNVLKLIYDGPEVSGLYWPNPDNDAYGNLRTIQNSTRIAFLDNSGRFFCSDRQVQILYLNASDAGDDEIIKRRLTLDVDGNLRIYSLQDSTGLWKVTWQALPRPCRVHGICGRNGLCYYGPEPKCSCPPGYVVVNPNDWSRGCKALFNMTALITQPVKFLEISQVDYWGFDLNFTKPFSLEDCKNLCLKDHNCMAFAYRRNGEASCYTKSTLYNGYRSPDFPGSIFLKLPRDFPVPESGHPVILTRSNLVCSNASEVLVGSPSMYEVSSKKVRWVYLYSFCSAVGGIEILVFVLGWWALFSKHGIPASLENGYCMLSSQFRMFTYAELKKATKNFKMELGRGGSGAVYKGVLTDGKVVAVKKLGDEFHGEEQFWAEMTTIGKINHMNLVRMWGFCAERKHRLLVYEYVENSSLDKHIYTSNFLGWKERFEVALGTAKGLAYLHHECLEWVIHCDVKPENILLTGEHEPKIADFGLAKLSQRGDPAGSYFTKIRGTKGYMAPEWAQNKPITSKVDVYGYGVVILEMVKGSRLSSWAAKESEHQQEAVDLKQFLWAMKSKVESRDEIWVEDIVDKRLEGEFSRSQARTLIKVGVACVEEDRNMRPTMASVVQTLLECDDEATIQTPDPLYI